MPKATQTQLEDLHGKLADALKDALENKEGALPAAVLNTARQFLSDNNIEADLMPGNPEEHLSDDDDFAPPSDLDDESAYRPDGKSPSQES